MRVLISTHPWRRPPSIALWLLALVFCLSGPALAGIANEDCTACHEEVGEGFRHTAHGIYLSNSADAEYSCESCHGDGTMHIDEMTPESIYNPAKHDPFTDNNLCLNCHNSHAMGDWEFASHRNADVTCSDCHSIHLSAANAGAAPVSETCFKCHSDVRSQIFMPSHHPIGEGKLDCTDCHNPHGGEVQLAMDDSGRELCFGCHAQYEGPFLYEHAPASEDCGLCHVPHGSVANNLLKQTEPALCLNCHSMHFHAAFESVDGAFETPQAPERADVSTPDGFKAGMLTKCTQCHTVIHGSDHPSQTMSTGGNALTR